MSGYRRIEIYEPSPSLFIRETSISRPKPLTFPSFSVEGELGFTLDLLNPNPNFFDIYSPQCFFPPTPIPTPFDVFESVTDLIQIEKSPFKSSYKRIQQRSRTDFYLQSLCDRVSALETGLDLVAKEKKIKNKDRNYSWTAEIKTDDKNGTDRKYKWTAEIKGGAKKNGKVEDVEKNYKWIAEIKGQGKDAPATRTYTFKASTLPAKESCKKSAKNVDKKKDLSGTCTVEIEEPVDQGTVVLRQAFARRAAVANNGKGKKKELSPQDAAMMIQMSFRAYLIRRSQALRALRELAVAKAKLKELRALFNNFSYRHRIVRDAEERQKFSEKIIVLLLTVDSIEGADLMVRAARRSMVDELEAMLDVVDPQPSGKLGSMKRRKFDLPEGGIQKEIAAGVAEVVQMLNQEERNGGTFEVCL
ncbi:IQ motif [Macleaya cordata]|uniref:IQ motif n=1 Tax=Macleaya cordata TaxID=56857 RepID=A0A200Q5R0_MACCD|nr:IQ motif [Macleaya cordata]